MVWSIYRLTCMCERKRFWRLLLPKRTQSSADVKCEIDGFEKDAKLVYHMIWSKIVMKLSTNEHELIHHSWCGCINLRRAWIAIDFVFIFLFFFRSAVWLCFWSVSERNPLLDILSLAPSENYVHTRICNDVNTSCSHITNHTQHSISYFRLLISPIHTSYV